MPARNPRPRSMIPWPAGCGLRTAVTILPTALLAVAAGAIWGWLAVPVVWASAICGETLAFVLGRFFMRGMVQDMAAGW